MERANVTANRPKGSKRHGPATKHSLDFRHSLAPQGGRLPDHFGDELAIVTNAKAQTFTVLHYFTGGPDGAFPEAGVTIGPSGAVYGTAGSGVPTVVAQFSS